MLGFYKYLKHLFFIYWPFTADEDKLKAWMSFATNDDRQRIIDLFGKKNITEVHPTAFRNMIYRLPKVGPGELSTVVDNEVDLFETHVHHGTMSGRTYDPSADNERLTGIPDDGMPMEGGDVLLADGGVAEGFHTTRVHEPDHTVIEYDGPFTDGLALLMGKDCDAINQLRSQVSVTKEFFYDLTNGPLGKQLTKGGVVVNRRNKRTKIITEGKDAILYEPRRNLGLFKIVNLGFNQGTSKLLLNIEVLDKKRFDEIHSLRLIPRLNMAGNIITFDYLED